MEPGDIFVVMSDGVVEAESPSGEPFGTRRVIDVITKEREGSADELVTAMRQAVAIFTAGAPPDDDRTLLIIKRTQIP